MQIVVVAHRTLNAPDAGARAARHHRYPARHLLRQLRAALARPTRLALAAAIVLASAASSAQPAASDATPGVSPSATNHDDPKTHPYLGMWVTADGHIRHELLPNGRYDEQRGQRAHAYQGRYWIKGNRIAYLDDTGFTADGEFRGGRFHHGGYVFFREGAAGAGGR